MMKYQRLLELAAELAGCPDPEIRHAFTEVTISLHNLMLATKKVVAPNLHDVHYSVRGEKTKVPKTPHRPGKT